MCLCNSGAFPLGHAAFDGASSHTCSQDTRHIRHYYNTGRITGYTTARSQEHIFTYYSCDALVRQERITLSVVYGGAHLVCCRCRLEGCTSMHKNVCFRAQRICPNTYELPAPLEVRRHLSHRLVTRIGHPAARHCIRHTAACFTMKRRHIHNLKRTDMVRHLSHQSHTVKVLDTFVCCSWQQLTGILHQSTAD